jgi:hypothetical protein
VESRFNPAWGVVPGGWAETEAKASPQARVKPSQNRR